MAKIVNAWSRGPGLTPNAGAARDTQECGDDDWICAATMPLVDKERRVRIGAMAETAAGVGICSERPRSIRSERNGACLAKLGVANEEHSVVEIDVGKTKRQRLGDPQTGAIEQAE